MQNELLKIKEFVQSLEAKMLNQAQKSVLLVGEELGSGDGTTNGSSCPGSYNKSNCSNVYDCKNTKNESGCSNSKMCDAANNYCNTGGPIKNTAGCQSSSGYSFVGFPGF